jgi:hypothetical protein
MKPTSAQLRQMKRENLKYPDHLVEIPRDEWPPKVAAVQDSGSFALRAYRSRRFLLVVWDQGGVIRLSVMRTEWDERKQRNRDDITWDDLQRLKGEVGYGDRCAVELFPPDDQVVNVANMRHLFITPCPIFMWRDGE